MFEGHKDWYLCHRTDSQIDCLGPFIHILEADAYVRTDMTDPTLIHSCRYMPEFMTSWNLKKQYNNTFSLKKISLNFYPMHPQKD